MQTQQEKERNTMKRNSLNANLMGMAPAAIAVMASLGLIAQVNGGKPLPPTPEVQDPSLAGEIQGVLTAYGVYGAEGWDVYIPGRSFFVRTGADGTFVLNYVPAGTYNLMIAREGIKVREMPGIVVASRRLANLGQVEVFLDADQDGYPTDVDCNDNDATVYPGAAEICDGKDNDCDGEIDEGLLVIYYYDADGDGYGGQSSVTGCSPPPWPWSLLPGDCDDHDTTVYPGAPEICDTKDNDCDGWIDPWGSGVYYRDRDGDGYGDSADSVWHCGWPGPEGYVNRPDDCNDNDASINPEATETPNDGIDSNCDGMDNW
jgi:hypothetical protein